MAERHWLFDSAAVGALSGRSTNSRRGGRDPSWRPSPGPQGEALLSRNESPRSLSTVRDRLPPPREPPRSMGGGESGIRGPFLSQEMSFALESSPGPSRGARGSLKSRGPRRSLRGGSGAKGPFRDQSEKSLVLSFPCLSLAAKRLAYTGWKQAWER